MHLHSFWWRVTKRSWKSSWEPFENFGRVCALVAGMVAVAFIAHLVTQEWTIALPVIVWWIWFFWNLIKVPHEIHEEDLAAAQAGTLQKQHSKSGTKNFVRFIFIVIIVSAFMGLLAGKNRQIAELKKLSSQPRKLPAPNFLFTKVLPPSEPPPSMPTRQMPVVDSSAQLENFPPDTNDTGGFTQDLVQMQADNDAQKSQVDWQHNLEQQTTWTNSYPYFHEALIILHDQLHELSKIDYDGAPDGITQPENYYDLPKSIDQKNGAFPLTHIGFQRNTNINFAVTISGWEWMDKRKLIITCPNGTLALSINWAGYLNGFLDINNPAFPYHKCVPIKDAHALISYEINALIRAQWDYSQKAVKNTSENK
jgi:hypothetical protein